jgi:hypothetical protein
MVRGRLRRGHAEAGQAGKAGFSLGGSGHDSCPDYAQAQPKRTIIPVYTESQSVTGRVGRVTFPASLTSGRRCPGPGPTGTCGTPGCMEAGSARSGQTVRPVRGGIDGRDVPIPVVGTRRSHLAGIVIRVLGKITRRWSRNDPCGSCGGDGPRRSLVAKRFRGSAQQRRWARWESVSICVCTTVWRLPRLTSTRKYSAP